MKALWRISRHNDLAGLGGEKASGRWHTAARGRRIVYLSEHPALALIEVLVNLRGDPRLFPDTFQLMKIEVMDDVVVDVVPVTALAENWRENGRETRDAGDRWLAEGRSALLAVPSAPSPESMNYLLNPLHPQAQQLKLLPAREVRYDRRLFHFAESGR